MSRRRPSLAEALASIRGISVAQATADLTRARARALELVHDVDAEGNPASPPRTANPKEP